MEDRYCDICMFIYLGCPNVDIYVSDLNRIESVIMIKLVHVYIYSILCMYIHIICVHTLILSWYHVLKEEQSSTCYSHDVIKFLIFATMGTVRIQYRNNIDVEKYGDVSELNPFHHSCSLGTR